jgi:hypothetical protein
VKVYTLQVGAGSDGRIDALEHSETLGAADLVGAIGRAKEIILARSWQTSSNVVRLLEETGEDSQTMWFRPMEAIKNA